MGKAESSSLLGRPTRRRNDSIKTDVKDTEWMAGEWIDLV
jgi:hypothetical protein